MEAIFKSERFTLSKIQNHIKTSMTKLIPNATEYDLELMSNSMAHRIYELGVGPLFESLKDLLVDENGRAETYAEMTDRMEVREHICDSISLPIGVHIIRDEPLKLIVPVYVMKTVLEDGLFSSAADIKDLRIYLSDKQANNMPMQLGSDMSFINNCTDHVAGESTSGTIESYFYSAGIYIFLSYGLFENDYSITLDVCVYTGVA